MFTPEAIDVLEKHTWPGNVRELANVIEHATILCDEPPITPDHLPQRFASRRGPLPKVDYEIELDAMKVNGSDFFVGLTFPYKESHASIILMTVTLVATCPSDPSLKTIPVEGGCVTYEVPPGTEPGAVPSFDPGGGLRLMDRSELVATVERDVDLTLCGAAAPPCGPS